jgi:hypothetical protein
VSSLEFRLIPAVQPLTGAWQHLPIRPRGNTLLGISFRPLQASAFGLDGRATLQTLPIRFSSSAWGPTGIASNLRREPSNRAS